MAPSRRKKPPAGTSRSTSSIPPSNLKTLDEYQASALAGEDDTDVDSDEAFDSDDEQMYGEFFGKTRQDKDDDDEDDDDEDDDDDDDDDDSSEDDDDDSSEASGTFDITSLLTAPSASTSQKALTSAAASRRESAHSLAPSSSLTMDALLDPLSSSAGFQETLAAAQRSEKRGAAKKRLDDAVTDRITRTEAYVENSKEVSKYIPTIQQDRSAETLDFRPKGRTFHTTKTIADAFSGDMTEFERRIREASDRAARKAEPGDGHGQAEDEDDDDLGRNAKLTLEEEKRRFGELSKVRSLLFYEELKRHAINKIKSKKYRKIRKRKADRLKAAEAAAAT
eukprot:CAMPEP_0182473776 /NCGR_PEP_ID=MMETSP1319-20130603/24547_1 /TAXON_ID=172717 /ORGANISM="Bolidomonas pacifica, Strain RCC208" /LENGTH=336 /DNA_ID=CAMNT_0024674609 /DNA_START=62 /DNA_END=1069 /DNA_ORIENTATION=+